MASKYRVYFEGIAGRSFEDVRACSLFEATALIAAKYMFAIHISGYLLESAGSSYSAY